MWDKLIAEDFSLSMAELAWTSFQCTSKIYRGKSQGDKKNPRIHPTQKPVALYSWLYGLFAKPGFHILDTHLGSGSSAIAAHDAGMDFVGCEIDADYFNAARERYERHVQQQTLNL